MAVVENNAVSSAGTTRILPADAVFHEAADIFPAMSDAEFRELVEDIREYGQREPVWILADGRVIDGRHRVKACGELGRSVEARVYHGSNTSVGAFVVSLNLKRRHLSENQRAMVAARLANLKHGDNQYTMDAQICASTSQPDAAELLNVSRRSVQHAVAVQRAGTPELIAAVRDDYATACGLTRSRVDGLYYSASKRYFRAPKARGGGISMSSMLQRNDLRSLH